MLDRQFGAKDILDHVLRIPDEIGGFAQFDHILLSRLSRTASIFEPKNYAGRLSRNEHGEWMIWNRNRKFPVPIPNPVAQAKRRRAILEAWLRRNGHDKAFEQVGIFVSIPPTAEIDRTKIGGEEPVYRCDNLYDHWREFGGISPLGRIFSTSVTAPVLIAIAKQLVADHSDPAMEIFDRLGIRPHSQTCDETRNEATDVKPPASPSDQDAGRRLASRATSTASPSDPNRLKRSNTGNRVKNQKSLPSNLPRHCRAYASRWPDCIQGEPKGRGSTGKIVRTVPGSR